MCFFTSGIFKCVEYICFAFVMTNTHSCVLGVIVRAGVIQNFKSVKALKSYEPSKIGYSKVIDVLVRASFVACNVVTQQQIGFKNVEH